MGFLRGGIFDDYSRLAVTKERTESKKGHILLDAPTAGVEVRINYKGTQLIESRK